MDSNSHGSASYIMHLSLTTDCNWFSCRLLKDTHFISHVLPSVVPTCWLRTLPPHLHSFLICSTASICFLLYYSSMKDKNITKLNTMQSATKTEDFIVHFLPSLPLSPANSFFCFAFSHIIVVMCNETLQGQGL